MKFTANIGYEKLQGAAFSTSRLAFQKWNHEGSNFGNLTIQNHQSFNCRIYFATAPPGNTLCPGKTRSDSLSLLKPSWSVASFHLYIQTQWLASSCGVPPSILQIFRHFNEWSNLFTMGWREFSTMERHCFLNEKQELHKPNMRSSNFVQLIDLWICEGNVDSQTFQRKPSEKFNLLCSKSNPLYLQHGISILLWPNLSNS